MKALRKCHACEEWTEKKVVMCENCGTPAELPPTEPPENEREPVTGNRRTRRLRKALEKSCVACGRAKRRCKCRKGDSLSSDGGAH